MSEEIKKEAQDVELNQEELDKASGGYTEYDPGWCFKLRFIFTEQEVQIIQSLRNVTLEAGREYTADELKDFGIGGGTTDSARRFLANLGIFKS
jgi:hypothetical protein